MQKPRTPGLNSGLNSGASGVSVGERLMLKAPKGARIADILNDKGREIIEDGDFKGMTRLEGLMESVYVMAEDGNLWCINFIAERTEGKAPSSIEAAGSDLGDDPQAVSTQDLRRFLDQARGEMAREIERLALERADQIVAERLGAARIGPPAP